MPRVRTIAQRQGTASVRGIAPSPTASRSRSLASTSVDGFLQPRVAIIRPVLAAVIVPLNLLVATHAGGVGQQGASTNPPIRTEFRVFDGPTEVTPLTRLRVRPSGSTETGRIVEGGELTVDLPPGIYDVQAVRQESGQVISVRWAERLVIMPYPDEGGRHLEVINFTNQFGALQLRWPEGQAPDPAGIAITVSRAGETRPIPSRVLHGLGYLLLVLPAETYDVRVTRPGLDPIVLSGIEVPPDRTRMKVIH
jgi:hypothetical protein